MNLEEFLFDQLSNDSGVSAIVSTRVYPTQAPQKPTYPFVLFWRSDGSSIGNLSGLASLQRLEATVEVHATSAAQAGSLRAAVRSCLDRYSGGDVQGSFLRSDQQIESPDKPGYYPWMMRFDVWMANSE